VFALGGLLPLALLPVLYLGLPHDAAQGAGMGTGTGTGTGLRTGLAKGAHSAAGTLPSKGQGHGEGHVAALFTAGQGWLTVLIWTFAFLIFSATYALQLWMPTLLGSFGFTPQQAPQAVAALGLGGLAGAGLLIALSAAVGVFMALPILLVITVVAIGSLSLLPLGVPMVLLAVACMGVGLIGGCLGQAAMAISLYAPADRTSGVGWAAAWGRMGSIAGPALGGLMLAAHWGPREIILWACAPVAVAAVVVLYLGLALARPPAQREHAQLGPAA